MSETKSVFFYGKPTKTKIDYFTETQEEYTRLINYYIQKMADDCSFYLAFLNNNKQAPVIRDFEKTTRRSHSLGSAYGQNAIDYAVKELHNHFIRIRNKVYGYIQNNHPEMEDYISFISLLNCALCETDEIKTLAYLLENEKSKEKPSKSKMEEYEKLLGRISKLTNTTRADYKAYVAELFREKLTYWKLPQVKNVPLQVDSRVGRFEISHSTEEDLIVFFKALNADEYVPVPISTSRNSMRRLQQYKTKLFETGKCNFTLSMKNGQMKISVPFEKKIKTPKAKKKNLYPIDLGITDLIHAGNGKAFGTFTGMRKLYEELVEKLLGNRSTLRHTMRTYQKQLKKETNLLKQEKLRKKIFHIARNLNGKKNLTRQQNRYSHQVDLRLSQAVKECLADIPKGFALVHEDLDIVQFDRGKKNNKRDSMWVRGKMIKKLTEKCKWQGIPVIAVDPAYTSKACPKCHQIDDRNRSGKLFVCTVCKHTDDADHNATVNIGNRAFDTDIAQIVEKFKYSTDKRHQSLHSLYQKRHEEWLKKHRKVTVAG